MIRLMTVQDYEAVYAIWSETAGMGLRALDDTRDGIEKFLIRNPLTNFVYLVGDSIVGVILCGHDGRRAYIYHMAVLAAYRGQGIGSLLVDKTMDVLKAEGIHKAALVVYGDNQVGNDFWEKKGFIKREDLTYRNFLIDAANV